MNPDSKTDFASLLWFYSVNQAVTGPVSFQELASLVQRGTLPPDVLAVPEGREDWKALSEWRVPESQLPPPLTAACIIPPPGFDSDAGNGSSRRSGARQGAGSTKDPGQQQGRKNGCGGCMVLIVVCLLLGVSVTASTV